ncbi:MAG: VOC family protein [Dehalococcoidia bacterium]
MQVLRTLTRVCVGPNELDRTIAFYEAIYDTRARMRYRYPAAHLEVAEVGGVLLVAGDEAARASYAAAPTIMIVDSIEDFRPALIEQGASILEEPVAAPSGAKLRARHQDGMVVEYVQYDRRQDEACHGRPAPLHAPPRLHIHLERAAADPTRAPRQVRLVYAPEDTCDVA